MNPVIEVPRDTHPVTVSLPERKRSKYPFVGFIRFQGLEIDVENKQGETRKGVSQDGTAWESYMHYHYGELRNTEGTDGDPLDCYIGPNADSPLVVVIHQHDPDTGKYDEDKVMLGFNSVEEAIGAYKNQYDRPGFYREGQITVMVIGRFWRWVQDERKAGKRIQASSFPNKKLLGRRR